MQAELSIQYFIPVPTGAMEMTSEPISSQWITELNDQYFQALYRLACANLRGTGCESMAEDIVQDVLLEAHLHEKMLRAHPNIGGWLYQTAFNLCKNAHRAQNARNRRSAFSLDQPNAPDIEDREAERRIYAHLEKQHTCREAVGYIKAHVTEEEFLLFERRFLQRHSLYYLSLQYGLTPSALKMRLHRLRKKIGRILEFFFEQGSG